ncbi:uncharacterized protein IL334_005523 [Kwoniella shivajii]|uniref:Uncharacterized protein n=1 Tax=Kwoniella shivajii TaxID=564305 RepID=A0ABZ1D3D3_9TREE|nr:hypothetical protein IL334_005523 [Kwoniella shivajii]
MLYAILLVVAVSLPTGFATGEEPSIKQAPPAAQIKLHIPKYTEYLNATDIMDHRRGEYDIYFNFTQYDLDTSKTQEFVWSTLEHVDAPETTLITPYRNMTCFAFASDAFQGTAEFTLAEKSPWLTYDVRKPGAAIYCMDPECLAGACKEDETPDIDSFIYWESSDLLAPV